MQQHCSACDQGETALRVLVGHGERLTDLRRDVLMALHHSAKPVGAYDLFDQLKTEGRASAPPAVYRVLDFLVTQGLAHKLTSISAYAACKANHHNDETCFAICSECGLVLEIDADETAPIKAKAADQGFTTTQVSVEIHGICADCSAK
jgi:Fur family transcriptional regulator, zinc uptake regulator